MLATLPEILAAIRERHPAADATVERFDSGAYLLNVRLRGRLFELRHAPDQPVAVDEITADDGFDCGYAFAAPTLAAAGEHLLTLLAAAAR